MWWLSSWYQKHGGVAEKGIHGGSEKKLQRWSRVNDVFESCTFHVVEDASHGEREERKQIVL